MINIPASADKGKKIAIDNGVSRYKSKHVPIPMKQSSQKFVLTCHQNVFINYVYFMHDNWLVW